MKMKSKLIVNKKAEKIISVYWFAILFIVAATVVYMAAVFYGQPYDAREVEADILTDKIADCISYSGYLKDFVLQEGFDDNFLEVCNLNFNVEDFSGWREQGQYYVELEITEFNTGDSLIQLTEGNSGLESFCFTEGKNLPYCLERKFYVLGMNAGEQNQYSVDTLVIVRKTEKNT